MVLVRWTFWYAEKNGKVIVGKAMVSNILIQKNHDSLLTVTYSAAFALALVATLSILQDYAHSLRHSYDFYISESLLFKTYWLCNLPTLLCVWFALKKGESPPPLLKCLSIVLTYSAAHLMVGTTAIWLLSSLTKEVGYSFGKLLIYAVSNDAVVTIVLYCCVLIVYQLSIKRQPKVKIGDPTVETPRPEISHLQIKQGQRQFRIDVKDIQFIASATPYVSINVDDKVYLYSSSIKKLSAVLDDRFIRVHRGTIVNLDKVLMSESRLNGDYDLHLSGGASIRLSRTFVKSFKSKYLGTSA